MDLGTYFDHEGRPAIRFEHSYPYPVGRVWEAVTASAELARWFPSEVTYDPRVGATISFHGDPYSDPSVGTILEYEAKSRFGFTWGQDELHFTLEDLGGGCRLVLVNVLAVTETAARNASGWTVCLAEFDKVLADQKSDGPHGDSADADFEAIMKMYVASGMPSGAGVPEKNRSEKNPPEKKT